MKEIKAFIKPHRISAVIETLKEMGFESVTLSECEGTGSFKRKDAELSLKFHFADSKMVKLELVCQDEDVDRLVTAICSKAETPYPADGIIYITDIVNAYRIKGRTPCKK